MAKILIFTAIIAIIYILFFRKKSAQNDAQDEPSFEMVECASCKTFISKDEAVKKGNKYFCDAKCLGKNG